jgi:hypothetical protein
MSVRPGSGIGMAVFLIQDVAWSDHLTDGQIRGNDKIVVANWTSFTLKFISCRSIELKVRSNQFQTPTCRSHKNPKAFQ